MLPHLKRSVHSRKEYPNHAKSLDKIPETIELPVDKERDLLVGRLPRAEGQPDFCDVIALDCAIRVPRLLSCQHAYIVIDDDGDHSIRDMGTLNGTYVNGNVIPNRLIKLKDGDEIGFGGPRFVKNNGRTVFNPYTYVYEKKRKEGETPKENPVKKNMRKSSPVFNPSSLSSLRMTSCEECEAICPACGVVIPRHFTCIKARNEDEKKEAHYHANISCLKPFEKAIVRGGIDSSDLKDDQEQEKNLLRSLHNHFRTEYLYSL